MVRNAPSIMCLDVLLFWIVLHQRWPFSNLEMVMEKYCNICCSLYFGLYTIILTICALFPRLYLSIKMHYRAFFIDHICPSYMEVARKYNIFQTIIVFYDAIKSGASSNPLKFQLSQCYARCNLVQLIKFANEKLI